MSKKHSLVALNTRLKEYYSGKRLAVAGGAGFVGQQLVSILSDLVGMDGMVMVLDDFSRGQSIVHKPNVFYAFPTPQDRYYPFELWSPETAGRYISVQTPGIDVGRANYAYLLEEVDAFFNLAAAVAGVLHNENNHLQMYDDNVRVLTGPLRACEQAGVPAYFQTSSVCVYAEDHQSPCDESEGWGGDPHPANAGYAESKRDGERAALWSNIPNVVIGRPSNIIGPHDYYDGLAHVVPAFIHRSITTTGTFDAYGSAVVQREFIFSWDVAMGMATALALGVNRDAYNIGANGENTITMLSLATKINQIVAKIQMTGPSNRRVLFDNSKGGGDSKRFSDASKLRSLGWQHAVGLDDALEICVSEYLYRGGWKDPDYWKEFVTGGAA